MNDEVTVTIRPTVLGRIQIFAFNVCVVAALWIAKRMPAHFEVK